MTATKSSSNQFKKWLPALLGLAFVAICLSPVYSMLPQTAIAGVPIKMYVVTLTIFTTPVFVLSTILQRFDVDFADESNEEASAR